MNNIVLKTISKGVSLNYLLKFNWNIYSFFFVNNEIYIYINIPFVNIKEYNDTPITYKAVDFIYILWANRSIYIYSKLINIHS